MSIGDIIVATFVLGSFLYIGSGIGRLLERNDCARRLRRQHAKHLVTVIRKTDVAYGRGKVFGYELSASRLRRELARLNQNTLN